MGVRISSRVAVGWLLVVCGLSILGYVVWNLYGTNLTSAQKHREVTSALQQQWAAGRDSAVVGGAVGRPVDDLAGGDGAGGIMAAGLIRIPRLGSEYLVPVLEGTSDEVLEAGFGHFEAFACVGDVDGGGPSDHGGWNVADHLGDPAAHRPVTVLR